MSTEYNGEDEYYEEGEGEWEVEKLLAKRKNKETKEPEYKVLWAGCTEGEEGATSWELKSWLEEEGYDDMVLNYEKHAKAVASESQKKSEAGCKRVVPEPAKKQKRSSAYAYWYRPTQRYVAPPKKEDDAIGKITDTLASIPTFSGKNSHLGGGSAMDDAAEEFVNTFEGIFLRGNVVEPTITRLLGKCNWDVKKAWTQQLETYEAKAVDETESDTRQESAEGEGDEEEDEDGAAAHDEDGENMFMVAPTTFFESADILLVIMSFSGSRTFFNACEVNKRWNHVGHKMSEVRGLVRNFCLGLQRSLTCCGCMPVALGSAGTSTSLLKKFLRQANKDLHKTPDYDGRNGGGLFPLYGLEIDDGGVGADYAVEVGRDKVPTKDKTKLVGTATVLDSGVPIVVGRTYQNVQTICISVGRMPTPNSTGRVELVSPAGGGLSFGQGYKSGIDGGQGIRTQIRYCAGHTELVVPVIYVRVVMLKCSNDGDEWRRRLSTAYATRWRSELNKSVVVSAPTNKFGDLLASAQSKTSSASEKKRNIGGDDDEDELNLTEQEEMQLMSEYDRQEHAALVKDQGLWNNFLFSLPPPLMMWQSFTSSRIISNNPFLLYTPGMDLDFTLEVSKKKHLTHDETYAKMNDKKSLRLLKESFTEAQRSVMRRLSDEF